MAPIFGTLFNAHSLTGQTKYGRSVWASPGCSSAWSPNAWASCSRRLPLWSLATSAIGGRAVPPSRAQPAGPTVPPRRRCRGSPVDAPGARSKGASLFDASQVPNPLGLPLPLVAGPSKWPVPSPCSLIRGRPGPGVGPSGARPIGRPFAARLAGPRIPIGSTPALLALTTSRCKRWVHWTHPVYSMILP